MNKPCIFGFTLLPIALLTGLGTPAYATRSWLSAHLAGLTGRLVLVELGSLNAHLNLGTHTKAVMNWSWLTRPTRAGSGA